VYKGEEVMGLQFTRGTRATLFANFLTVAGTEPVSLVNPKITIRHIDPDTGLLVVDVNEAAMTIAAETLAYYNWDIDASAHVTTYDVEYEATIDGEYVESSQNVQVLSSYVSAAGAAGYTTVAAVAALLGVDESEIDPSWIDWATGYINTYTCRSFGPVEETQLLDIEEEDVDTIFLKHFPIISVTYVKNDGDTLDPSDYLIYNDIGVIRLRTVEELTTVFYPYFTEGRQKVEVKYTHGYATIPHAIVYAATLIVARIAKHHLTGQTSGDIAEKQIGDTRVRYFSGGSTAKGGALGMSITDIQENILKKFRRIEGMAV
jgi:hypothetical protein